MGDKVARMPNDGPHSRVSRADALRILGECSMAGEGDAGHLGGSDSATPPVLPRRKFNAARLDWHTVVPGSLCGVAFIIALYYIYARGHQWAVSIEAINEPDNYVQMLLALLRKYHLIQ